MREEAQAGMWDEQLIERLGNLMAAEAAPGESPGPGG
jgi:hypothetical protein